MGPRQHRQYHLGDQARHACHCGLMFARRGDLRSHERWCPHVSVEERGISCHCGVYLHDWNGWTQHLRHSRKHWGEDVPAIVAAAASGAPAPYPVNADERKQEEREDGEKKEEEEEEKEEEEEEYEEEGEDLRSWEIHGTRKHSAGWKRTCPCGRICETMAKLEAHRNECFITPLVAGEHVCYGKRFINDNAWEKHKSTSANHQAEAQDPGTNNTRSGEKEGEKEVPGKGDPEAGYPRLPLSERNKRWSI